MEKFLEVIREQFIDTEPELITAETKFRELDEWSSLASICIIAAIDDEYHVPIKVNDILACTTVNDLYELVKSRM